MPKFSTFEERMKHPQGKLIPSSIWNDNELFGENLDDTVLSLMKVSDEKLLSLLERSTTKLNDPWLKKQAWLAIALSHPDTDLTTLQHIAQMLEMDDYGLFSLVIILGNTSHFDELAKQYPASVIAAHIVQNVFYVYIKAAENGHLELLKKMETKIPEQITEMVRVANFAPYARAAKNGHIAVLNHLEQTRPDLVPAMVKASFKNAALHHPVVLEHMKELAAPLQTPNHFFPREVEKPDEEVYLAPQLTVNNAS
ncbi:hypothetical protein [Legionella shakespearei]|uniref:Ankyrin repeat family transporter protein n=1 Tax=Legionella shakespearei DSM 23087 TaxID=1122169 RepID=A0A0W0YL99_9GAMM|nr:hypothetical protein [Legionella shakespearei]KTD57595.1 ankyrin repeat family transporter protein [Legionella shakespearei DSM 23087]